jgi:hypothetical protein
MMNKQSYFNLESIIYLVLFLIVFSLVTPNSMAQTSKEITQKNSIDTAWAQLPSLFEASQEPDGSPLFMTRGKGYFLTINNTGHVLELYTPELDGNNVSKSTIQMNLVGAQSHHVHGNKPFLGKINYLIGNDKNKWKSHVNSYSEVVAAAVYPGIDLRYYSAQQKLEYDFIVAPKTNPDSIRLAFEGIDSISINSDGNLMLSTKQGDIHHQKPVIYQIINGQRVHVEGHYSLFIPSEKPHNEIAQQVGFTIGKYNDNYPLIIDPILDYASYIGGSGPDQGSSIAVDTAGNIYITGTSFSTSLPIQTPYQDTLMGRSDIFIAKFNPSGDTLLFATYLGGQDYDKATGISIDAIGNIVLTGTTRSHDFPIKNAIQGSYGGGTSDAFVSKFNADGSELLFSSYIGGQDQDDGYGIAIDSQNDIYITGETSSNDFPLNNAYQPRQSGHADAYVVKFNSEGSQKIYASYLGGSSYDSARSIAVDSRGFATITGITYSQDFPVYNALQADIGGNSDAFISQLNADGTALKYSTYLGGASEDQGLDIAIDNQNNAVIVGQTGNWFALSQQNNFPTKNALQTQGSGLQDGFFSKISADGDELVFSSYFGGEKDDALTSIAIDDQANLILLGTTESTTGLPVINALQQTLQGNASDVYIAKIDNEGATTLFASYFGGSKNDKGLAIAVKDQTLYMTGTTASDSDFPSKNALQPLFGGGVDDMFIAKIGMGNNLNLTVDSISPFYVNMNSHQLFTVTGSNLANAEIVSSNTGLTIFDVSSSQDSIEFRISANNEATLGESELTFSSTAGSAVISITVAPPLPTIVVSPAPIATLVSAASVSLDIHLSGVDVVDHTMSLTTSNPDVASISPNTITIIAGQQYPSQTIQITSHAKGSVSLDITSTTLNDIHTTIFATENPYVPEIGEHTALSGPLGIIVTKPDLPSPLIEYGPFVSQLRLLKESSSIPKQQTVGPVLSSRLAVNLGNHLSTITPYAYLLGSTTEMVISGQGLTDVTAVEIIPADGITIGAANIAGDGTSITLAVTLSADAKQGVHQVILSTATGHITPETVRSDRIYITQGLPEIESISPIIMVKGQIGTLKVRGRNLKQAQTVTVLPSDGITVGSTITVNSNGTELSLALAVDETATLGARTVIVSTPAGSSTTTALASNTLTINSDVGENYSGILSPEIGVVKGQDVSTTTYTHAFHSSIVGLSKGATLTGISPKIEAVNSTFEMALQGYGLQDVDAIRVEPSEGVTVSDLTVNADGKTVTVTLSIDSAAPQTERKIIASANGVDITASSPTADRFLITALQPEIYSITPNYLLAGGSVTVTVQGQYLNNAQAVSVSPVSGISTSTPTVNVEGTELTVTITAAADAAAGGRLFKVLTPGGETSNTVVPTNTLTVISDVAQIRPVYTTSLGVQKQTTAAINDISYLQTSPLLGINKQYTPSVNTQTIPMTSAQVGVVLGVVANNVSPKTLPIDTASAITITGTGLNSVQSISFIPEDGISQTGSLSVSSDKTTLVLPVAVTADATQDTRQIVLHTESGTVPFITATADRVKIVDNILPQLTSLTPIQQIPGSSITLTINGENLQNTVAVAITPAQGISLSTPTLSSDNTQLTVQMIIAADAAIGERVVTVQTLSGNSTTTASAANTFSVVNQ